MSDSTSAATGAPINAGIAGLRWPIGFLLGRPHDVVPVNWRRVVFPIALHVHPRTGCVVRQATGQVLAILGEVVDPEHPELDLDGLVARLALRFADRQAEIDRWIGRFVVISGTGAHDLRLQTDAIAMRAVFFAHGLHGVVAGSHAKMVALASGDDAPAERRRFALGWPGIGTPHPGVLRVPANVELAMATGQLCRFFPLRPVPRVTLEAAWDLAFERARSAVMAFARRTPLIVSLTAGLDSRTTLAALRDSWPDLEFFTYQRDEPSILVDCHVASGIAAALGLRHRLVELGAKPPNAHLLSVIKDNTFGNHGHGLACAYHRTFGAGRFLHVRTNLLELARSNLFAANDRLPALQGGPNSAERMAAFYARAGRLEAQPHMLSAFEQYIERTDYAATTGLASPWDLYFVEHRMGAWHAGILLESDIAFDTVIAFNSREVVRHIMGVPQAERAKAGYLQARLARMLPEIASVPINPKQYSEPLIRTAVPPEAR